MKIDVARIVGAVTREIRDAMHEGKRARVLVASRRYDTTVEDLWDALTNAERINRWFLPVSGELRLGGKYQLEGNASGTITACEPPRHLALTWSMHGQLSWVDVKLAQGPARSANLVLEHTAHVPDDMWNQFGPGAVGVGWDQLFLGLDRHFGTRGAARDPRAAMAWLASDEGRTFVVRASDAWADASIAAGTDAASARAAAARSAGFYLPAPAPQ